jgi:hypothetical protein
VLGVHLYERNTEVINAAKEYDGQVIMDLNGLDAGQVGVEMVITENEKNLIDIEKFELKKVRGTKAFYAAKIRVDRPGTFNYGVRIYPKNDLLPHRQDFGILHWV